MLCLRYARKLGYWETRYDNMGSTNTSWACEGIYGGRNVRDNIMKCSSAKTKGASDRWRYIMYISERNGINCSIRIRPFMFRDTHSLGFYQQDRSSNWKIKFTRLSVQRNLLHNPQVNMLHRNVTERFGVVGPFKMTVSGGEANKTPHVKRAEIANIIFTLDLEIRSAQNNSNSNMW